MNRYLGTVQNLLEETSEALEPISDELKDALPEEPVLNGDETGGRDRFPGTDLEPIPADMISRYCTSCGVQYQTSSYHVAPKGRSALVA